ncbi:MAG: diguanylate cyclase [Pseudomonadota bacterium]|nr:diguanylate cyclase [Pseudomonadota bacterium]
MKRWWRLPRIIVLAAALGCAGMSSAQPMATESANAAAFDQLFGRLVGSHPPRIEVPDGAAVIAELERLLPPGDSVRALRLQASLCSQPTFYDLPPASTLASLQQARKTARDIGDQEAEFHAVRCEAALQIFIDHPREGLHANDIAISIAQSLGDQRLLALAYFWRGSNHSTTGQQAAALSDMETAARLFNEAGVADTPPELLMETMSAYRRMGMHEKASQLAESYRQMALGPDGQYRIALAGVRVAFVHLDAGDPQQAWQELRSVPAPDDPRLTVFDRVSLRVIRAHVLMALDRPRQAIAEATAFERAGFDRDFPIDHALILTARAHAYAALGQYDNALADYNRAQQQLPDEGNPRYMAPIHIGRAHARAALGQAQAALLDYARGTEMQMTIQANLGTEREALREMEQKMAARESENATLRREQNARDMQLQAMEHERHWQIAAIGISALPIFLLGFIAIQQYRRGLSFRRRADTDALTGAHSRAGIQGRLDAAIRRNKHAGGSIALVAIDIDHFKSINDRYGHPQGDDVLREVVACARASLRSSDALGRIGGEEFLIVCAGTAINDAERIAERIRCGLHGLSWPAHPELKISASFGVTTLDKADNSAESVIARADRALYRAKQNGRDRVESADD